MAAGTPLETRDHARRQLLADDRTYATTLFLLFSSHFGDLEWMTWEPDVLAQEIKEDFGVDLSPEARDKIWAFVTALTTNRFYNDPMVFNHVANALLGQPLSMIVYEPATLEEMAWAVLEVGLSDLEGEEEPEWGPEVVAYVSQVLRKEGVPAFPPLDFASDGDVGAPIADDPEMAAQFFQSKQEERLQLLAELEERTRELHRQIQQLGIARG
jgi:hypothetical protein